jgi:hypothetical protein
MNKCWLGGDHLLLSDFERYGIIFITIIYMFTTLYFPLILGGKFTDVSYNGKERSVSALE